ncbi:twin-arginine translocase subunit TatC [Lysobacter sp. A6]|uniref:Sec-independent protein translocase protein TatC n=1 Tax=Noviluteimonas lactosilytica TaxID=2888523 RepID=A0ABS8JHJ6_9GAMM|nr:twin-arginine translocase subunit TatC [Lysobacter lactosilyticus]MCC8363040.1 twin-arginine translocase subunit TatC [Lysobacter lactosilyticus]
MQDAETDDAPQTRLIDHLIELRSRLMWAVAGLLLVFAALMPFAAQIYNKLALPLISQLPEGGRMIAIDPAGGFFVPVKLAFFTAVFITAPWLLYQAWSFVAPGLYRKEKRLAAPLLVSSVLLFYAGCAFAYFLVLPAVFHFLTQFTPEAVQMAPDLGKYVDFVLVLFLAFGASFELPIALVILVALGWVTPKQLREWRGYAVVGIFVIAAIITPPDVVSQLMLAIPMMALYEIGIIASRFVAPKKVETEGDAEP